MSSRRLRKKKDYSIQIGEWTIQGLLARARVQGNPGVDCDGSCCRHGVHASLTERDRIMAHAARIKPIMDKTQTQDEARWFEPQLHEDDDFPEGLCVGTATYKNKCAFLNGEGRCVLQILEPELDLPEGQRLKPWYCFLFPITTWFGRVEYDDMNDGERPCCTLARNGGGTPAVDAFEFEFRFLLGDEGYEELCRCVGGR